MFWNPFPLFLREFLKIIFYVKNIIGTNLLFQLEQNSAVVQISPEWALNYDIIFSSGTQKCGSKNKNR